MIDEAIVWLDTVATLGQGASAIRNIAGGTDVLLPESQVLLSDSLWLTFCVGRCTLFSLYKYQLLYVQCTACGTILQTQTVSLLNRISIELLNRSEGSFTDILDTADGEF